MSGPRSGRARAADVYWRLWPGLLLAALVVTCGALEGLLR